MDQKEVQMLAAEFVLGTLNRAMLLQFKNELSQNPALRTAVKDWERRFGMERGGALLHREKPDPAPELRETSKKETSFSRKGDGATEADPILDQKTQREVQATLEQISLDSTLASRVRCGQAGQRVPRRVTAATPSQSPPRNGRSGNTARALVSALEQEVNSAASPDTAPKTGPKADPETKPEVRRQQTTKQLPKTPEAQGGTKAENDTKAEETERLSRDQAALKVQSVLKAARNILSKQAPEATDVPRAKEISQVPENTTAGSASQAEETPPALETPPVQDTPTVTETPALTETTAAEETPPAKGPSAAALEAGQNEPEDSAPSLLRAEDGTWDALAPRVYKKRLNRDDNFNRQSYLLRMIPGGRIQPQRRGGIEEIYVVEGRVKIGENTLGPGDFQAFAAKSFVPEIAASGDSLVLVRGQIAARIPDPEGTA